jgi:hypothetical protein
LVDVIMVCELKKKMGKLQRIGCGYVMRRWWFELELREEMRWSGAVMAVMVVGV